MLLQDHTRAGLTADAARGAIKAIAHQATALGCAVNVRVLSYDEAAAVQVTSLGSLNAVASAAVLKSVKPEQYRPPALLPVNFGELACLLFWLLFLACCIQNRGVHTG